MKLKELKNVIKNIVRENISNDDTITKPAPTIKPGTKPQPPKPRRPLTPPETAPSTKPKAKIKESEAEILKSVVNRFKKLKND
jgi:hypothetical protein